MHEEYGRRAVIRVVRCVLLENSLDVEVLTSADSRRSLPSWLMSLCIHLAILIVLAVALRQPARHALPGEERTVGITLAQAGDESVTYWDRESLSNEPLSRATPLGASSTGLPDASDLSELEPPAINLPGSAAPTMPADGVLSELELVPGGPSRLPSGVDVAQVRAEDAALPRQRGPQGPTTRVSVFGGAPVEGRSFIFVIDRSQSMGRGGLGVLALATKEFDRALSVLQPIHQFQIVAYNHDRVYFGGTDKLLPATAESKQMVGKFMHGLAAFGATVHFSAIMSALNRSPDVLFLLTDGGDPPLSNAELVQIHRRAAGRTTIHCIQFGRRPSSGDDNFLQRLARENGGSYRYINVTQLSDR